MNDFRQGRLLVMTTGLAVVVVAFISLSAGRVSAQSGEQDYRHYCGSCHGLDGKGKGSWEGTTQVPDLTHLSAKKNRKFPFEEVYEVVDGRSRSPWHQPRPDMPFWGDVFEQEGKPAAGKAKAEVRITAIVEYIRSLQEK